MFDGANEKVPLPNIETEELEIIGEIITHAFITHGIFPVQICKSSLLNVLYGESNREVLLASILNFLPDKGAAIIRKTCGESVNLQAITDVLNENHIFAQPNANNVYDLCCSAAKMTLIMLPNFSFQTIRK